MGTYLPKSDPSEVLKATLGMMEKKLRLLLQEYNVHYGTQVAIHNTGYFSLWEFGDMYVGKVTCRREAAAT